MSIRLTTLGKSEFKVSTIGFGALQASGQGWKKLSPDDDVISAIKRSYELGINFIDTAETYGEGRSERVVGKVAKEIGRQNLVIATKVHGHHLRFEELQRSCEASLNRLGIREIDLYQVHWPDPWEQIPLKKTFKAMEKLYKQGKIRAIGVCNFAVRDLKEAMSLLSHTEIVSNQVRYNLIQREIESEVMPFCKKNRISIIAWSPIAQGALSGKYSIRKKPSDEWRANYPLFSTKNMLAMQKILGLLKSLAHRHKKTPAQIALNWILSKKVIPIPGAKNVRQAEENAGAEGWRLTKREMDRIEECASQTRISYYP